MSANSDLLDLRIIAAVELLKQEDAVQGNAIGYLKDLKADIELSILNNAPTEVSRVPYQKARLNNLLKEVDGLIASSMGKVRSQMIRELKAVADEEAKKVVGDFKMVLGVEFSVPTITAEQIIKLADDTLVQGAPSAEWWARQIPKLRMRFADQMRAGIARGETTDQLVNRIRGFKARGPQPGIAGLMDMAERDLYALVRTSVQTVANAAHLEVYDKNDDVVKGIMWVATLDSRTTPICQALDGLTWDNDLKPIGHKFPFPGPTAHWGCRSTQSPVLKSWEELAREAGGDTTLAAKLDKMPAGNRASLEGEVPQSMNYEDWLRKQPEARQVKILGRGRFELWSDGKIKSLTELVSPRGDTITLRDLKK
jgi:SPP1 gp7 family putative phage head morphogenesis protein